MEHIVEGVIMKNKSTLKDWLKKIEDIWGNISV